ncbi:MAG TPA: hypothetical protein VN034_00700 [Sphingopyxis sp.]|nr:hypothetical protein [Sphingopyxis sp.]
MADLPPPPPGFELVDNPRKPKSRVRDRLSDTTPSGDVRDLGTTYGATGRTIDGDTIQLQTPPNALGPLNGRLSGYDAFERGQLGYRSNGSPVALGMDSTNALAGYITPQTTVFGVGSPSYGRPVVGLNNDGQDPVNALLRSGQGYAAPQYLSADPERAAEYMEAERLGRMNRQGGFGTTHVRPDAYRRPLTTRTAQLASDEYLAFNDELPDDAPKLKRLSPEQDAKVAAYVVSQAGNPNFSLQQYRDWFRNELGVTDFEPVDDPKFIDSVRKGEGFSPAIDYSNLDAQSMRDLKELIAFSGLRPEDAKGYRDLLAGGDAEQVFAFAKEKGMSLDPDEIARYIEARQKGEAPAIPLPQINPGDGAFGAGMRGFGDTPTSGLLDELGALPDALGLTGYRENVWNSDRSFGEIYDNNLRQNRAILDYDATNHPYARFGGQMVGGLVVPFGAGARGATGMAKVGGAYGGAYAFGSAEGDLGDRLKAVPGGVAIGAAGGAILGKGIEAGAPVVNRLLGRGVDDAASAASPIADDLTDLPPPPPGFQIERGATRADMAADDVAPSITSDRIPDVIDVNAARTRPLGDGPSPNLMRAATARVEPEDVLPRASNELTPEEAARLGEGPYRPVPAPRERDYLDAREYPSRAKPDSTITRRGPADLVTFARSLNGIRDEGGELTAAGISNAPRKGDDFAGGENRLGRLVNDTHGVTIEEAAQRAWSEGYFPELAGPPTREQFVAALDDTYRGVNRRFRPDDEPEIQAFEGARDQRLAVERAKQEGAPLVDDLGQPTTYDDVIANTPPAISPDDWNPATLAKVGNVRVDKLDSPQEISRALKVADDITGGFDNARRGRITQAETEALATDLGMTADDLLARRKGQALNAEEALAARRILSASGNELVNLAKRVQRAGDEPGSELLAAFRKAMVRHTAIQEQVSGATAEAGRALAQFRMVASSRDHIGRVMDGLVNAGGGPGRLKEAADMIITLEPDPATLNRFIEKASKPKWSDKLTEVWYNFLLSGPQTHAVNVMSNTMTALAQIPEHAVAAGIGNVRRVLSPSARQNLEDRIPFTEVGARAIGLIQGTKEGMREFARALRTGEATDFVTKVENQSQKAVSGLKGEVLRLPTRFLTAEDELFKGIARRMELSGLAVRTARQEGLRGAEGRAHAAELLANPTDDMMLRALDYARYVTFQRPLGEAASKVSAFTQALPITKIILPFVRTPTNLFKSFIEHSPGAPLLKEWRRDFAAGGARRDMAVARVLVGTGMGATVAEAAARGDITGSPPTDDNKRRLMMADGWQPYSVKIGDKYYSYQRLDPFALTIGAAADMATLRDGMTDNQRDKGAARIVASIMGNLSNKTWLSGVSDMLAALDDPDRFGDAFIKRFAGSATVPTGVAQVARTLDPTARMTPDVKSAIQNRIPGMSDDLLPKRDVWGRPIEKEGGLGPDIMSPIWTSTEKGDPATWEALRVGATISPPSDRVNGQKLDPKVYDQLQAVTGPLAHEWVSELIKAPEYRSLDLDGQAKAIKFVMEKAKDAGKANVMSGVPIPTNRPVKGQRRSQRQPPPPPPGFVVQ